FEGSDRQGRGRLVDALRRGPVAEADLAAVMGWPDDPERAARVAATLVADGLARSDGGVWTLGSRRATERGGNGSTAASGDGSPTHRPGAADRLVTDVPARAHPRHLPGPPPHHHRAGRGPPVRRRARRPPLVALRRLPRRAAPARPVLRAAGPSTGRV